VTKPGILWNAFGKFYGTEDAHNLVWQAATRTMNPTVPQSFIDPEFERDAVSTVAEYGAEFRGDISGFLGDGLIEAAIDRDRPRQLPPRWGQNYAAFIAGVGWSA
jgi:hypothetical protein